MKCFAFIPALLVVAAVVAAPPKSFAEDLVIADVRRNIPLSDEEPIYKDYYLNAGESAGLKKNLVVTAIRKVTVRDASGAQAIGDLEVPVGQLRILAVFGKVSVAREYKSLSRDEHPMLEQNGILIGDRIDLKNSFIDNKSMPAPKRKVAEATHPPQGATSTTTERVATSTQPVPPSANSTDSRTDAAPTAAIPATTTANPVSPATRAAASSNEKSEPQGVPVAFLEPTTGSSETATSASSKTTESVNGAK